MHEGRSSPGSSERPSSTTDGTPKESLHPERGNVLPGLQTLQSQFLAVYLPLVVLAVVLVLGTFGVYASKSAEDALHKRIDKMVTSQSDVIADPLRYRDHERIQVILKAILVDDDVTGVAVYDEPQKHLTSIGDVNQENRGGHQIHAAEIVFKTNGGSERIGQLIIYHSDNSLTAANHEQLIWGVVLCLLLIAAAVVSALVANWRVIALPLGRLRTTIALAEKASGHASMDWKAKDEFGELAAAFNKMQTQQQRYDVDLHAAREDLERRVEDRTRELRMARDDAETANRAKTQFLQNMSHELRTPLNAILGFSDLIRMSASLSLSVQKNSEYAKDINKSALFLLDIVNDLLDMSRIEAEALHPKDNRIDAMAVVVECLNMVRLMAQSKDIELVNNLPEKVPAVVGDHRMIKQVFLNILSNALKFTDRGGRVEVSVAVNNTGGMDFRFTDNGRGIAPGDIETIFQPFNRIVRPLVTREEGTGLGLPLAKALIDLHGGVFTIESKLNESTTAVVALPAERILAEPSAA